MVEIFIVITNWNLQDYTILVQSLLNSYNIFVKQLVVKKLVKQLF